MWIYCEKKEAYIVASIATGAGANIRAQEFRT